MTCFSPPIYRIFQSTPSAWRETHWYIQINCQLQHFNPLPPHGGRPAELHRTARQRKHFNPLPPHGGRPPDRRTFRAPDVYFNPLPPHGGRQFHSFSTSPTIYISIHSLRMEGDAVGIAVYRIVTYFNPLPPHGGRPANGCQVFS